MALSVTELKVEVESKEILRGVNLSISKGEVVALMGPNGSGKSSLANALMGHPRYSVSAGKIEMDGEAVVKMAPDERARKGLFLAFQYPVGIVGVSVKQMLKAALRARENKLSAMEIRDILEEEAKSLQINEELLKRDINEGFSGGEKKKMEILQLRMLKPKYAILDETDSGLDIDALRIVAEGANRAAKENGVGVLVITHYQRILKYLKPDRVVVLKQGKIVAEGGDELVRKLEEQGYQVIEE